MVKKKKYPKIKPFFKKDDHGKILSVILPYNVYNSIFEEIEDLEKEIADIKKKESAKSSKIK